MSAQCNDIIDGRRARRDFYEREWLEASRRSAVLHEMYVEAERELARENLRRVPEMAPAVRFYGIEDVAGEVREAA